MTGCWLTVKEASLLLGSVVREAPIAKTGASDPSLFESQQLTEIGEQLMHYMAVVKHNGAVEKAQAGFIALCERSVTSWIPVQMGLCIDELCFLLHSFALQCTACLLQLHGVLLQ